MKPTHCQDCPKPIRQPKRGRRLRCEACNVTRQRAYEKTWHAANAKRYYAKQAAQRRRWYHAMTPEQRRAYNRKHHLRDKWRYQHDPAYRTAVNAYQAAYRKRPGARARIIRHRKARAALVRKALAFYRKRHAR